MRSLLLPVVAILGLLAPGGLFMYWLLLDDNLHDGRMAGALRAIWSDRLALAFIIDVFLTTGVLAAYFARNPPLPANASGAPPRWRWPWFVVFSVCGTLVVGLALYWWLNTRPASHSRRQAPA
ncbi:MAG TPA: hypothetical protein VMS30_10535 [Phycisphaerales bacterium]|nr:hypothetical protein [Phycisphaerales bacterium]